MCTNQAIVDIVSSYPLETVLDIGCGEGWLTRALRQHGKQSYGVDAVPVLIKNAVEKDGHFYQVAAYAVLAKGIRLPLDCFDAAVMNFSLLDEHDTANLVKALPKYIKKNGFVFIQTLHPAAVVNNTETGWKEGSWKGLKRNFVKPYDWYFRTLADWQLLFTNAGLTLVKVQETLHPGTRQPLSSIFVLQV